MTPSVTIVTTALPHRVGYLERLIRQAPWVPAYGWIICGPPALELEAFARRVSARFIPCDANMGTCRNLCAEAAAGDVLVQIDDDDWQHPTRIQRQIAALTERGKARDVVGSSWLYCLHAPTATASRISYWDSVHCLPGATLAYWRASWARHPFEDTQAEDGPFVSYFGKWGTAYDMRDPKLIVYLRHDAHKPEQRDWWRETRNYERRLSAQEIMQRRIANPGKKLPMRDAETSRDIALAHEEEAATVYVRWLMGADFDRFLDVELPSVEPRGEVIDQ